MTTVRDYLTAALRDRGTTINYFQLVVRDLGQDWCYSYNLLSQLERAGVVQVIRSGPGVPLQINYLREDNMAETTVIGFDPGFGNTKICVDGKAIAIQSAVARPVAVGLAANGMRVADSARRVTVGDAEYVVGRGAWNWGRSLGSMDFSGIAGPERLALMYAAISQLRPAGDLGNVRLVVGLPVPLMQDNAQMIAVKESLKGLKRAHLWAVDGEEYSMVITSISLLAQPAGGYFNWVYNDELAMREGAFNGEVAVLDLGMNTLDLFVMAEGKLRPSFMGGDKAGARRLLELLNTNGHDIQELDEQLRTGRLRVRDDAADLWLSEVLGVMERTWPALKRFRVVIPTGGGAVVLDKRLSEALAAKGAALAWPDEPVLANVKGLWKYGVKHNAKTA